MFYVFKLTICIIASSNSLNSLINRLKKGDLVEKSILARSMVSNLEINQQKSPLINGEDLSISSLNNTF